jgi:hypothetical protein
MPGMTLQFRRHQATHPLSELMPRGSPNWLRAGYPYMEASMSTDTIIEGWGGNIEGFGGHVEQAPGG